RGYGPLPWHSVGRAAPLPPLSPSPLRPLAQGPAPLGPSPPPPCGASARGGSALAGAPPRSNRRRPPVLSRQRAAAPPHTHQRRRMGLRMVGDRPVLGRRRALPAPDLRSSPATRGRAGMTEPKSAPASRSSTFTPSMGLLTSVLARPLDPGYEAAARRKAERG